MYTVARCDNFFFFRYLGVGRHFVLRGLFSAIFMKKREWQEWI